MATVTNKILNAFTLNLQTSVLQQGTNPTGRSSPLYLPELYVPGAKWTDWQFVFHAYAGTAPTQLAVTAQFQRRVPDYPNATPTDNEFVAGGQVPLYQAVTPTTNPELFEGDDWPNVGGFASVTTYPFGTSTPPVNGRAILNYPTDSLPKAISNRVSAGFRHRVLLGAFLSGGDATTGIVLSCTAISHYDD